MLTKMKLALAIAAPLVAGAATYAAADSGSPADRHAELIQKFDQNGDGKLDDSERAQMKAFFQARRQAHRQEMLAKYDTNHDGKLEPSERAVMRDDKLTARFAKLDTNHDGVVTLDEFKANAPLGHRHGRHMHHRMRAPAAPGSGSATGTSATGGGSE
jgi:hypothetical protein